MIRRGELRIALVCRVNLAYFPQESHTLSRVFRDSTISLFPIVLASENLAQACKRLRSNSETIKLIISAAVTYCLALPSTFAFGILVASESIVSPEHLSIESASCDCDFPSSKDHCASNPPQSLRIPSWVSFVVDAERRSRTPTAINMVSDDLIPVILC